MKTTQASIDKLLDIMARLRDPEHGCPWDRKQTFETIVPYTIEEAYEVADAIERGAMDELKDELGDLLFQVVFYAQMAQEEGHFDFYDVVSAINEKMLRRHPHVFGDAEVASVEAQSAAWEAQKAEERAQRSHAGLLDGIAATLPALARAEKLQRRAAKAGFDWPDIYGVEEKIHEELAEVKEALRASPPEQEAIAEEIGDLLFACANLARHAGVDAEGALRAANRKFEYRFRAIEEALMREGRSPEEVPLEELDALWEAAKRAEEER